MTNLKQKNKSELFSIAYKTDNIMGEQMISPFYWEIEDVIINGQRMKIHAPDLPEAAEHVLLAEEREYKLLNENKKSVNIK